MIAISAHDLHLEYGISTVIEGVSFTVNEGEKIGIAKNLSIRYNICIARGFSR